MYLHVHMYLGMYMSTYKYNVYKPRSIEHGTKLVIARVQSLIACRNIREVLAFCEAAAHWAEAYSVFSRETELTRKQVSSLCKSGQRLELSDDWYFCPIMDAFRHSLRWLTVLQWRLWSRANLVCLQCLDQSLSLRRSGAITLLQGCSNASDNWCPPNIGGLLYCTYSMSGGHNAVAVHDVQHWSMSTANNSYSNGPFSSGVKSEHYIEKLQ